MSRVGLFGGSFDPVTIGHVLVAQAAMEEARLDRLVFIPASQSPLKPEQTPAPARERLRLLRLSLAGFPQFEIDDMEIQRGGVSYTIDTVREYLRRHPDAEMFYLIGADHVPLLNKWRQSEELARLVQFLVIPRPGEATAELAPPFRGQTLQGFPFAVSSSQVRARVKAGQPIDWLVTPAVAEAIRNNRLYL